MSNSSGIVIVANRLPITRSPDGRWEASAGGLVSALHDAVEGEASQWVGWPGGAETAPSVWNGQRLRSVLLSDDEVSGYYDGCSNSCLWPLLHDGLRTARMAPDWWATYRAVNQRFAAAAAEAAPRGAVVWVHDYHLLLVPALVRRLRPDLRIGYFHHVPFPPPAIFRRLPWRDEIIDGLSGADLVGFQTAEDAEQFRACRAASERSHRTLTGGARPSVGVFPATIDVAAMDAIASLASTAAEAAAIRSEVGAGRRLMLGVDRLDYTKAITARLEAFGRLLDDDPGMAERVAFIQIAVPTREGAAEYRAERAEVHRLVGAINGRHGGMGRPAVLYRHGSLGRSELAAFYRAADVMVVTPWRDGMNLVAKEYVTARPDEQGVLVLSEFAGAAVELGDALLVNPFDVAGLTATYRLALDMSPATQRARIRRMRAKVRSWDSRRWAACFLDAVDAGARRRARETAA